MLLDISKNTGEVRELKSTKAYQYEETEQMLIVKHHGEKVAVIDKAQRMIIRPVGILDKPHAWKCMYRVFNYLNSQYGITELYEYEVEV